MYIRLAGSFQCVETHGGFRGMNAEWKNVKHVGGFSRTSEILHRIAFTWAGVILAFNKTRYVININSRGSV